MISCEGTSSMNSRDKGQRGELLYRDYLKDRGYEARRGQQFHGGPDSPDVVGGPEGYHIEVKFTEKLRLREAIAQATKDAKGKPWYIAHKWNRGQWYGILPMDELLGLIQEVEALKRRAEDLQNQIWEESERD